MANRWFLYISELAQKAQQEVTRTPENWQKFLTTASRFYKSYDFDDQLLIYIQRPDAVACADIETWNNKMHRWVTAGSNAIGLIRKGTGGRPYIQNVHDVSDTHRVKGGKDPWLWRMEEAYHAPVMERLAKAFGIPEGGDLGECLMEAASKVSEEHYGEYLRDLHYEVEDSFLEGLDDHNIEVIFRDTIKASVQYAVLTRCGLDASLYIDADDLRGITNFNNVGTLACLGTATAEANRTILMEIGEAVKNIQLEQVRQAKKSLAKQPDVSYNKDEQFNTLKRERSGEDERIDIHQPERLSDSEHRDGQQEERTGNPDPVRQGEGEISDGTPESGLHGDAVERNPVGTSDGDRPGGEPAGRERDGGTGDERGRDGGTESSQPDGMGTADEQHPAESRGDRDPRSGRTIPLYFKVSPEEKEIIDKKMELLGTHNQRAYLRKMAVDGYVVRVDMTDVKELAALLRTCSNNLNQIARRVNSTGNLYGEDIADLKTRYGELWGAFSSLLSKFEDL